MNMADPNPKYWAEYSNLQCVKHALIREYLKGWFPNGINLSRRFFASQALAEDFSRLRHAVVFFGSAFDDARFVAVGTFRVHLEVAQLGTGPSRSQSAQRVGKADAFHGNLLAVRGLRHDGAY
jgi:hypothetical protein